MAYQEPVILEPLVRRREVFLLSKNPDASPTDKMKRTCLSLSMADLSVCLEARPYGHSDIFRISALQGLAGIFFVLASSGLPAAIVGFEEKEGFPAKSDISQIDGWRSSSAGAGEIALDKEAAGTQSLRILKGEGESCVKHGFSVKDQAVVFVDFRLLPCADPSELSVATVDANGAVLGFLKGEDGRGHLYAVPPTDKEPAVDVGFDFSVDTENAAKDWVRVTIRQDLLAKTWDLYVDGKLTLVDQPLSVAAGPSEKRTLAVYQSPVGDTYLDNVLIGPENSLFPDKDKDGIPDAMELANGLSIQINDRDRATGSRQGETNILQFLMEGAISRSHFTSRNVIYVDSQSGDDTFTGRVSYRQGGDGPKATVSEAAKRAGSDTVIAIMEGSYFSFESHSGKDLNIMLLGDVTVVPQTE